MFIVKKDHQFLWPVEIFMPLDNGKVECQKFNVKFKILSKEQQNNVLGATHVDDVEILRDVVVGWDDSIKSEDGRNLEFNAENMEDLIHIPYVRIGIFKAYFKAISGDQARIKN